VLQSCHETAASLFRAGAISEERMREYDNDCLLPGYSSFHDAASRAGAEKPSRIPLVWRMNRP